MKDPWREGNAVKLLVNGEQFFPAVFYSIRAARREVILETFILYLDEVGYALQRELIAAAQRGIKVDLTVDDYGSPDLNNGFIAAMANAGVKVHMFDPNPKWLGLRLNMFRRLHRKIVVIDGVLAFIGGINYSVDHLEKYGDMAKQDYAVQVRGPVVHDIHRACLNLLQFSSAKKVSKQTPLAPAASLPVPPSGQVQVRALLALRDNHRYGNNIEHHYLQAIRAARSRLILAHGYFFPGYRLLRALSAAARRGVNVVLILQGQPDIPAVRMLSRLLYGYLLRSGVHIYEYDERPLHSKVALADSRWSTVGSSNLDPLSLSLNLEANLIFDDEVFNRQLYQHLSSDLLPHCRPISLRAAQRGYWWRLPLIFLSFHFLRHFPAIVDWLPTHVPKLKLMRPSAKKKRYQDDPGRINKNKQTPTSKPIQKMDFR